MNLFVDTEFTDFKDMEMISIGMISEDGKHEFYREVSDYHEYYRSDFVNLNIMPLLEGIAIPHAQVAAELKEFLDALPADEVTFAVDYVGDWNLLYKLLLIAPPKKVNHAANFNHIFLERAKALGATTQEEFDLDYGIMEDATEAYFKDVDQRQHHSLVDARAMRHGFLAGLKQL